jgi:ATP-dependent helicase/nuclease subunit A
MSEILWTREQIAAIRSEDDTLLVANAGTGKTTTVVGKIMWLLGLPYGVDPETGEPPVPPEHPCELHEIAAITFTEKAAYDLKRQLRAAIEKSARAEKLRWEIDRASVGTIHSFCGELLRENALRLGIDPTFGVMDGDEAWAEQDRLIRELVLERLEAGDPAARLLLQRMKLTGWTHTKGVIDHVRDGLRELRWHGRRCAIRAVALGARGGTLGAGDALDAADADILEICDAILGLAREARGRWDAHLEAENRRDFDSLILGARELLVGGGEGSGRGAAERGADRPGMPPDAGLAPRSETGAGAALRAIRSRYRILIVDEFQDTDFAQRDIAFAIGRGRERPQLFLVGDPKQSIYRFRGADIAVWNEVETEFREEGGRILELSQTFRNAPPIVEFVNHAARKAIEDTGQALDARNLAGGIRYAELIPGVASSETAGVEWLVAEGRNAAERRESEAKHVATWIRENVGRIEIRNPDVRDPEASGATRKLAFRDCAVLYRGRSGLEHFAQALTRYDIPYYVAGASYLNQRQEIVDVLNALRVLRAPRDDLRAFGFLRSPFVGLRDETIARIRLLSESHAPLLVQARRALDGEWPEAPDHPELTAIEREALGRGLDLLDDLRALCPRLPLDELIDELLERSGYRLHLLLMDRPEEVLANLQSLVHFAEAYRHLDLSGFFEVWERSASQEIGIPQAPLYSKDDDVVTLSTIHAAKGLEWPVVFFVGVDKAVVRHRSNEFWTDRELGPVFCLKKDDRGPRADEIAEREQLEAEAEEARLLYVAATRARDRLQIVGERGGEKGYDQWLAAGGVAAAVAGEEAGRTHDLVAVRTRPADIDPPPPSRSPALAWLDACELTDPPALIDPLPEPPHRWIHSATELMLERRDPEAWERRYRHGVQAPWEFAPEAEADGGAGAAAGAGQHALPATLRGTIIHGVLEQLEDAAELSRILDETIGSLEEPELESMLSRGARYREALEAEIRRVVESREWAWYTAGELGRDYWKELTFTHLLGPRDWRYGAFDLFRRAGADDGGRGLIVDFKTHPVSAERAARIARDYQVQADVYRAAGRIAGPDVDVQLHFTGPNAVVEMDEGGDAGG